MKIINYDLLMDILEDIKMDKTITEKRLALKYDVHERTIRRYLKILKENNMIVLNNQGKLREWHINFEDTN